MFGTRFGMFFIFNAHLVGTPKNFGYFPEICMVAGTKGKEMLFESYSHLNISGKYPTFLKHGLGGIYIVNEHPQHTQKFRVFPRNIEFGKDTKERNVV